MSLEDIELISRAPKASNWNRLLREEAWLNEQIGGAFVLLRKSGNQALSRSITTSLTGYITWDTVESDDYSLYSSGTVTAPAWANFYRVTCNLVFTATGNFNLIATDFDFSIGSDPEGTDDATGVRGLQLQSEYGFYGEGFSVDSIVRFNTPDISNPTVQAVEGTWLLFEFI